MTRMEMLVYVVALQRQQHAAQVIHLRRANALTRYMQKYPVRLTFHPMNCLRSIIPFSDSGFRAEGEKGHGLRGANHFRIGQDHSGQKLYHLIDAQCRGHRRVTRNTFSSELFAACDATDDLCSHALALHEITTGPATKAETLHLVEAGKL